MFRSDFLASSSAYFTASSELVLELPTSSMIFATAIARLLGIAAVPAGHPTRAMEAGAGERDQPLAAVAPWRAVGPGFERCIGRRGPRHEPIVRVQDDHLVV